MNAGQITCIKMVSLQAWKCRRKSIYLPIYGQNFCPRYSRVLQKCVCINMEMTDPCGALDESWKAMVLIGKLRTDWYNLFIIIILFFKYRTADTLQQELLSRTTKGTPSLLYLCWLQVPDLTSKKMNKLSDLAHWPPLLPMGAKDLFMVTAITAHINWPSESDLLALPLTESVRKSSGSAWLA